MGKEGRTSFLKKRSKKLLVLEGVTTGSANAPNKIKFFCFFFFKKRSSYLLTFSFV